MTYAESGGAVVRALVNGHPCVSVPALRDPPRERRKAMEDLGRAIPDVEDFRTCDGRLARLATTPDFHAGRPVPVGIVVETEGVVLPHLVGSDIGCGMRLSVMEGIDVQGLERAAREVSRAVRRTLFQGARDVALTGRMREALLRDGLPGMFEATPRGLPGILGRVGTDTSWRDLDRTCDAGVFHAGRVVDEFAAYVGGPDDVRWDAHLGSVGGGNHFVEIGVVGHVDDTGFARARGVGTGAVTVTVHTGSLDFGQAVATRVRDLRVGRVLPLGSAHAVRYVEGSANATNLAFANRLALDLAVTDAVGRATGREVSSRLVHDAPHNAAWVSNGRTLHRKGACPARGPGTVHGGFDGEPVIVPGSMGEGVVLMRGAGSDLTVSSAAHGAGRRLSRGGARATARRPAGLRLVGPVDLDGTAVRSDVRARIEDRFAEEAPDAYRTLEEVVVPMEAAGIATRVARVVPWLTAKA